MIILRNRYGLLYRAAHAPLPLISRAPLGFQHFALEVKWQSSIIISISARVTRPQVSPPYKSLSKHSGLTHNKTRRPPSHPLDKHTSLTPPFRCRRAPTVPEIRSVTSTRSCGRAPAARTARCRRRRRRWATASSPRGEASSPSRLTRATPASR